MSDSVGMQSHRRAFIQFGGPKPANVPKYGGQDAQYMTITGAGSAESGGFDPVWAPDPLRPGKYKLIGRTTSPADLPEVTVAMHEMRGSIPKQLMSMPCAINMYENVGACRSLQDFETGWSDYVLIYSMGMVTDKDWGDRMSWDGDEAIEDSLTLSLDSAYPVGPLVFGQIASGEISKEVVDVVFGSDASCGDCGPANDGMSYIYAVTKSSGTGSPGLPAELIYTTDGGGTIVQTAITGFGATEDPVAIDIVGNYLVIVGAAAYYYAEINWNTGAPGTFTKVTTGFVSNKDPLDIYVANPREVWFCGEGGYIYKSTNIANGVSVVNAGAVTTENLNRITGSGDILVCAGDNDVIVKSINRGATWALTTTAPGAATDDFQAVAVIDKYTYWVGSNVGEIYYTLNGGDSWTEYAFAGSGAGTVNDIVFYGSEVGFFAHATATPVGSIYATWNGGANWTKSSPRINSLPTLNRINRIAIPQVHISLAANTIAAGGLADDGSDGIFVIGTASRI